VKIPGGARVLAHTHPQDELVTVIEGTWYLGEGAKFDSAKLKGYPAGSFIVIPAGIPHLVAAKEGTVVVQLSGIGKFQTDYLEKWPPPKIKIPTPSAPLRAGSPARNAGRVGHQFRSRP